jgi:hypothetical protein
LGPLHPSTSRRPGLCQLTQLSTTARYSRQLEEARQEQESTMESIVRTSVPAPTNASSGKRSGDGIESRHDESHSTTRPNCDFHPPSPLVENERSLMLVSCSRLCSCLSCWHRDPRTNGESCCHSHLVLSCVENECPSCGRDLDPQSEMWTSRIRQRRTCRPGGGSTTSPAISHPSSSRLPSLVVLDVVHRRVWSLIVDVC